LPYEPTNSHSQPETVISDNYFATRDNTHNTADNISCDHSVSDDNIASCFTEPEAAVSCSTQCTAGSGYTVTCCLPSSLTRATTYNCSPLGNIEHSYDTTCSCCTAGNKPECIAPENSSQGLCTSNVADNNFSQLNATRFYSVIDNDTNNVGDTKLSSSTTDTDETSGGNLVPENSSNDTHVSSNIVDNTPDCPTPLETSDSSLHDNAHGYTTSDDAVPCGYHATDNRTCSAPQDIMCDHSTVDDTGFSRTGNRVHGHTTDNAVQNITHCHSIQIDAKHEYFFPDDVSHSCCVQDHTVHNSCKTAHDYCMPYDSTHGNLVPGDDTHGSCSNGDNTVGCTMPDNTDVSIVIEDNTPKDSHIDNTLLGYSVSDDTSTVHSHYPVSDTNAFSYLATNTDNITYSCSASEIVTNESNTADGCVVPDEPNRGSTVPGNSGHSYCMPDDNTNSCCVQLSTGAGCVLRLESDDIAVAAVGEACQPVQNDCGLPCPLTEKHSKEITTRNETVPDASEKLDDASCVRGTASGDLSFEHSTLPETVTRSQPSSVMTASSNRVNSVAESGEAVESDDIPTTQDFSHIVVCSAVGSFTDIETETPTSFSY